MKAMWLAGVMLLAGASSAWADDPVGDFFGFGPRHCGLSDQTVNNVLGQLNSAASSGNGGLFTPNRMWAAVVDRKGVLCNVVNNNSDAWPGSRSIAIAKASTANDFSTNLLALSTANLYAPTQPGGSLYGLNNSNPFNPFFQPQGTGVGFVPGGIITFGGGVALYDANKKVIGGLGVSGDTSCADHAVAYQMRAAAGYNNIPGGPPPNNNDNIQYAPAGQAPTGFQQPHCGSTDVTPP